jgi:ERCC4-type nuclease
VRVVADNRDPWPHPWAKFLPEGWEVVREKLETGDVVLSALPEGVVIERKTPSDMANCIGASRERFERELKRGRYVGRMIVVIEGTLPDVCAASRGISDNAITGTLAAWTLRYCPFVFCGSQQEAADFAFRFLAAQVRDIERSWRKVTKAPLEAPLSSPCQTTKKAVARLLAQKRPHSRIGAKSNLEETTNYPEEISCQF